MLKSGNSKGKKSKAKKNPKSQLMCQLEFGILKNWYLITYCSQSRNPIPFS